MPIYEYQCAKCHAEFEREQRITDDPIKTCPECRSRKVKRLISRTSFVLKGGGWYSDLYSSRDTSKKSESDKGKESSSDSKSKDDGTDKKSGDSSDKKEKKKGKGSKAAA